ncbi:MAG: ABC transporter permease [Roseibacillus sp.]|nr:ABC transporter permease [Roseibacillus sp.]
MLRTIGFRLLQAVIVVFCLETFTMVTVRLTPGGPFADEKAMPKHIRERVEKEFGLDKTIPEQVVLNWKNFLKEGDFGLSTSLFGRSVREIIFGAFPVSLTLGICAMIVALLVGIPSGVIAALRHNQLIDYSSMVVAMIGICIPAFVLGPLLQLWVARNADWLSTAGWERPSDVILPAITLGLAVAAYIARLTRGGMLDVLSEDFIRTARAKGVSPFKIITRHALRPALLPAVTYMGPAFAAIITGSFVVETIFQVPGMGQHFVTAVTSKDYFLLQGLVLFYGLLLAGANLTVDILLATMNPRLRANH